MIASDNGQHECLSILLAHGAEVDKADDVSAVMLTSGCSAFNYLCIELGWLSWLCKRDVL